MRLKKLCVAKDYTWASEFPGGGFSSTNYLQMEMGVTPLKSHGVVVTHSPLCHNTILKICVGEISKTFAETSSGI